MIPEEQWTKNQREFVGTQFPTPKGGVLTVVGVSEDRNKFICECSICSKDVDLWGRGKIKSTKGHFKTGRIPCGCSTSPRWTEGQNLIRVRRVCEKRGYIFNGWFGEYTGKKTKLKLENPDTGNKWESTTIDELIRSGLDPVIWRGNIKLSKLKTDEYHIQDFYKAGFTDDFRFWRSKHVDNRGREVYWDYTCPVCSNDEYVEAGVCSGVFTIAVNTAKYGQKSCRCAKSYRWTQEQREYQINKICKKEGITFIGWVSNYKNSSSKIKWICPEGHNRNTKVKEFITLGRRCKLCYKEKQKENGIGNGYYPNRVDEKDYLYVVNFNNKYIKVGRSFNVDERIKELRKVSKTRGISKLKIFTSNHQNIYDTEQWLHEELRELGFEYNEPDGLWSIELFSTGCLDALNYLLKQTDLEKVE